MVWSSGPDLESSYWNICFLENDRLSEPLRVKNKTSHEEITHMTALPVQVARDLPWGMWALDLGDHNGRRFIIKRSSHWEDEQRTTPCWWCQPYPHKMQRSCGGTQYILLLLLLSRFSRVGLCATPETAAHQAPPSLGFSRQEHWNGLPLPSPMHESEKWKWSHSVVSDLMDCSLPSSSVQARVLEWGAIWS